MRKLCVLGSTGSIGVSTLEVVRLHPTLFSIDSLSANTRVDEMLAQCQEFNPSIVVMVDDNAAQELKEKLHIKVS